MYEALGGYERLDTFVKVFEIKYFKYQELNINKTS